MSLGGGGGGSDKEAVEKQHEQDMKMYNFQNQQNLDKYKEALKIQEIDKANAEAARAIKNQTAKDNWKYQMDLKREEYRNDRSAYKQGLKDYDKQVEFNSAAAAVSNEAENRKLEEAIINSNFEKNDAKLDMSQKANQTRFQRTELQRQKRLATAEDNLNRGETNLKFENTQEGLREQRAYERQSNRALNAYIKEDAKLDTDYTTEKAGYDVDYAKETAEADLKYTETKFADDSKRLQADNFYDRIKQMTEKFKAQGEARAAGLEGNTGARREQSVLAEYGRAQAQLVDNLVMGKKELARDKDYRKAQLERDRDYKVDTTELTRDYQNTKTNTKKDFEVGKNNRDFRLKKSQLNRELSQNKDLNKIANTRLDVALASTKEQIRIQSQQLKSDLGYDRQRFKYSKDKIAASVDSAKKAKEAADNKIALDEYAANLAAHSKVPSKPKYPVALPVPLEIPEAVYPVPTKPQKGPEPIEGTYQTPNTWDYINQGANLGMSILSVFA